VITSGRRLRLRRQWLLVLALIVLWGVPELLARSSTSEAYGTFTRPQPIGIAIFGLSVLLLVDGLRGRIASLTVLTGLAAIYGASLIAESLLKSLETNTLAAVGLVWLVMAIILSLLRLEVKERSGESEATSPS
jgi:hypothetical protein